jgi:hypothetical protein
VNAKSNGRKIIHLSKIAKLKGCKNKALQYFDENVLVSIWTDNYNKGERNDQNIGYENKIKNNI